MQINWMAHRLTVIWLLVPLVFGSGCAARIQSQPPILGDSQEDLGTVGVVAGTKHPEIQVRIRENQGQAAAIGAVKGLGMGILGASLCLMTMGAIPEACLIGIGTPVVMVAQAQAEMETYVPSPREVEIEAMLNRAVDHTILHKSLRERIVQTSAPRTRHRIVAVEEGSPKTDEEDAGYRHLSSQGIDSVLEVNVTKIDLIDSGAVKNILPQPIDATDGTEEVNQGEPHDRLYALAMTAHARLVRTSDNELLSSGTYTVKSRSRRWADWSVENNCEDPSADCVLQRAKPVANALDQGQWRLAEQIVSGADESQDLVKGASPLVAYTPTFAE